jgi:hypothetical protein
MTMNKQTLEDDNCQVRENEWEGCLHNVIRLTNVNKTNFFLLSFFFSLSFDKKKTNNKEGKKIVNERKTVLLIYL